MLRIILKVREVPVLRGHPWIFSGAIEEIDGNANAASVVDVFDWEKHWIARGLFSPKSQIRVRLLTWQKEEIDGEFFPPYLSILIHSRIHSVQSDQRVRIVNGEGDFLPGLIVDRYSEFLVCQFFTEVWIALNPSSSRSLSNLLTAKGIFEKSEGRVRDEEGIEPSVGVLAGGPPLN